MLVDTTYFLKTLGKRIWVLISIPLVAGTIAYFVVHDRKKIFKSTAQLSAGLPVKLNTRAVGKDSNGGEPDAIFLNHVEAMKTEFIGSMVSYNLLLHDLEEDVPFRENGINTLSSTEKDSAIVRLRRKLSTYEALSPYNNLEIRLTDIIKKKEYLVDKWINNEDLQIERIGDTHFIKVEFLSENPFLSAFVVNTICTEYIRYNNSLGSPTNDSLSYYRDLVNKNKKAFESMDDQMRQAQDNMRSRVESNSATLAQLPELESQLKTEANRVNALWSSLRDVKTKIAEQEKLMEKNPVVDPRNSPKVLELQTKIDQLTKIYRDGGSKDEKLSAIIRNIKGQLQTELTRLDIESRLATEREKLLRDFMVEANAIESQYKRAESGLVPIRTKVAQLRKVVSQNGASDFSIATLESDLENARREYLVSKEKLERIEKGRAKAINGDAALKLMVMGQPNAESESFDPITIVAIVMAICFLTTVGIIFISTRIRTPKRPTTPTFVITR